MSWKDSTRTENPPLNTYCDRTCGPDSPGYKVACWAATYSKENYQADPHTAKLQEGNQNVCQTLKTLCRKYEADNIPSEKREWACAKVDYPFTVLKRKTYFYNEKEVDPYYQIVYPTWMEYKTDTRPRFRRILAEMGFEVTSEEALYFKSCQMNQNDFENLNQYLNLKLGYDYEAYNVRKPDEPGEWLLPINGLVPAEELPDRDVQEKIFRHTCD